MSIAIRRSASARWSCVADSSRRRPAWTAKPSERATAATNTARSGGAGPPSSATSRSPQAPSAAAADRGRHATSQEAPRATQPGRVRLRRLGYRALAAQGASEQTLRLGEGSQAVRSHARGRLAGRAARLDARGRRRGHARPGRAGGRRRTASRHPARRPRRPGPPGGRGWRCRGASAPARHERVARRRWVARSSSGRPTRARWDASGARPRWPRSIAPSGCTGTPPRLRRPMSRFRPLLDLREELLQVVESIAPIAAGVDAVETETPLVAPGPDRVGMDAQEARRLRDGERGIRRPRGERHDRSKPAPMEDS